MTTCLECGDEALPEHSVRVLMSEAKAGHIHSYYVECNACQAGFERRPGEEPVAIAKETWEAIHAQLWLVPPWVAPTLEADFLFSWDCVDAFFAGLERRSEDAGERLMLGLMQRLVTMFRVAGYDSTLRAGQAMSTLVVSRAREHGLLSKSSFLRFDIDAHGELIASGAIGGAPILETHTQPTLDAVKSAVDRLVAVPVE